jgi:hypothetical protein
MRMDSCIGEDIEQQLFVEGLGAARAAILLEKWTTDRACVCVGSICFDRPI